MSCSRLLKRAAELGADCCETRRRETRRPRLRRALKLNRALLSVVLRSVKDSGRLPGVVESVPVSLAIGGIKCPRKAESRIGASTTEMRPRCVALNAPGTLEPHCRRNVVRTFVCLFFLSSAPSPVARGSLETYFLLFRTSICNGLTSIRRSARTS